MSQPSTLLREQHFDGSPGPYFWELIIERLDPSGKANARVASATLPVTGPDGQLLWVTPADATIDVAALPTQLTGGPWSTVTCVDLQQFLTTSLIQSEHPGASDDVVFLNAFASEGENQSQNILVRHGSLVDFSRRALLIERYGTDHRSARPHLGRVSSFGTNAGAPVFIRLALFEKTDKNRYQAVYSFYLVGSPEAYLTKTERPDSYIAEDYVTSSSGTTALVAVAPAEEIHQLIDQVLANVKVMQIGRDGKK